MVKPIEAGPNVKDKIGGKLKMSPIPLLSPPRSKEINLPTLMCRYSMQICFSQKGEYYALFSDSAELLNSARHMAIAAMI